MTFDEAVSTGLPLRIISESGWHRIVKNKMGNLNWASVNGSYDGYLEINDNPNWKREQYQVLTEDKREVINFSDIVEPKTVKKLINELRQLIKE